MQAGFCRDLISHGVEAALCREGRHVAPLFRHRNFPRKETVIIALAAADITERIGVIPER